eukprot:TRINITY_DN42273_c0_g2_i1.p1 TRINITY_DN42273_c0_g2~~TRINITY_DN42273_c0_g2_i1.p1  ORF type:complete len:1026 (-),score=241.96 TRINITY_DN42273_c0_g2_i1:68-3145(-)
MSGGAATAGSAAARDPAKEHTMLCKVLGAILEPVPTPDLADLVVELASEPTGKRLCMNNAERVITAKLSKRALLADRFAYLRDCSKTADEVRRDAKFPPGVLELLPKIQQLLANYGGLSITCAELFDLSPVPEDQAAATLVAMWEKRELSAAFLLRLAECESIEAEQVESIFGALLSKACERLRGRDLVDHKSEELGFITAVCNAKGRLAKILPKLAAFHPPPAPPGQVNPMAFMMQGRGGNVGPPGEGYRLQTSSLLGSILSPTCIDTGLYKEKSARQIHFQGLARKTQSGVSQVQNLLRHSLHDVQTQAASVVNPLLRSGEESRQAVLNWFGDLITGTESRTKSANTLDEGGGPNHFIDSMENSPMPMHQNLDMRLAGQIMQAQMQGFATPGMAMNTFWAVAGLVKPIKLKQVPTLDPFFILNESAAQKAILGGFVKESRFGDSDEVEAAKSLATGNGVLAAEPKFPTQILWVSLRALHVLLVPVLKEEICFAYAAGYFQQKDMAKMEAALGEHLLHEAIFDSGNFLGDLGAMLNLTMAFCLSAAWPDRAAEIVEDRVTGTILPKEVSAQWSVLPSCILEDVIEVLEYYINIRPQGQPVSQLFTHIDSKLLLLMVTFMLGSGDHVRNPNLRGKATTILMKLSAQHEFSHMLQNSPVFANDIIPGCIRVFTAVEKTKQSYYDIRMQLKYQLRIPIMELFEKLIHLEAHKKSLKAFAVEYSDEFMKFLNNLMNDATMQLEEGLDTLTEIRRIVREGGEAALQRPNREQVDADEQTGEGDDIYRRSRADPKEHCKTYMKMGNRTIRTLWSISRETPSVIVTKLNVLQQLLQNCLNACLYRLVGPKCLELKMAKGSRSDFDDFDFKPKELLQMICEMYVYVGRADKEKVQKMITEDGRSYKPSTFAKAAQILGREQLISKELLNDFGTFVKELNDLAASQEAALANVTVPTEYLDPIMEEIMVDPVKLPTSGNVMDRKVIERHIMSSDDDPFTRAPLSVKELIPQTELRNQIHEFCAKHGISLGGEE